MFFCGNQDTKKESKKEKTKYEQNLYLTYDLDTDGNEEEDNFEE